jgi:hypothetical protein
VSVSICFIMTKAAIMHRSITADIADIRVHIPREETTESCHMFIAFRLVKNENVGQKRISWTQ